MYYKIFILIQIHFYMKKSFLSSLMVALFSLFSIAVFAKGTIKGTIVDAKSGEPLIGATVAVQGTTTGTVSNLDGSFVLDVAPGEKTLSISYIGYIATTKGVTVAEGAVKDLGEISLEANVVGLDEVMVSASYVTDRKTPVSVSTIKPIMIEEKLGSQELPEVLKSTPSVYATKGSGGFGDSRINIRGFKSKNIGALVNGVPVNDMENGKVYFSNWAGLADVLSSVQVQRGLGASKLAISSVGGTMNYITKSTDAKKGGMAYMGTGNDGYKKLTFSVSSGLMDNGWAFTIMGSHRYGDGYINGTKFDAWTYFFNISKKINDQHTISFTGFGAPQWHNARDYKHTIERWRNFKDGAKTNVGYGYRNGEEYGSDYGYNQYHKPQFQLNHYFKIDRSSSLNTAVYASFSNGGTRAAYGTNKKMLMWDYNTGEPYEETAMTSEGLIDYDAVIDVNKEAIAEGTTAYMAMMMNSHDWYGVLSTYNKELNDNISLTAGLDGRYYRGYHYVEIKDLLGGAFLVDNSDENKEENARIGVGDKTYYDELGEVGWLGVFLQGEYTKGNFTGFLSGSVSRKSYRWSNYFEYKKEDGQTSEWVGFMPYSLKLGASYTVDTKHTFYANAGHFTMGPVMGNVFIDYGIESNPDAEMEVVNTVEFGYKYHSRNFSASLGAYSTDWLNRAWSEHLTDTTMANITGVDARHQGIEFEMNYKPVKTLTIKGMFSYGDWKWKDDVRFDAYTEDQEYVDTYTAYIGGTHVGDAAQVTGALGVNWDAFPGLRLGADFNYYAKNYADFDPEDVSSESNKGDAWKLPEFGLLDLNFRYTFDLGNTKASLFGKVENLFDTEYISDALDDLSHTQEKALVFYGFGRTWSTGLKIEF